MLNSIQEARKATHVHGEINCRHTVLGEVSSLFGRDVVWILVPFNALMGGQLLPQPSAFERYVHTQSVLHITSRFHIMFLLYCL